MVADAQAKKFAEALTELCRQHGLMIWTGLATTPIMASTADDDVFHYVAERPKFGGNSMIIRRVLAKAQPGTKADGG
jgi:hypothetical protein